MLMSKLSFAAKKTYLAHLFKALTRQHHQEFVPILSKMLKSNAVIINVGAHAGQFTKLFAKTKRDSTVYAFEPASYTRSILSKVVKMHRLKNVVIEPIGLGDAESVKTLNIPIKRSGSLGFGLSHLSDQAEQGAVETQAAGNVETYREDVKIVRIDDYVRQHAIKRVDLIKADIEGWEMRMLAGAADTVSKCRPYVILEVNGEFLARAGDRPEDIWDFFLARRYKISRFVMNKQGVLKLMEMPAYDGKPVDILCMPLAV